MPNHKSAEKRMRQSEARRKINRGNRSRVRTSIKNLRGAIGSGDANQIKELLPADDFDDRQGRAEWRLAQECGGALQVAIDGAFECGSSQVNYQEQTNRRARRIEYSVRLVFCRRTDIPVCPGCCWMKSADL